MIDVHPRKCGAVIGSRGAVIHSMQERSGARIKLNQDFPDGEMRKLTITGSQEQVQMCAELVRRVLEPGGGSHSIHENAMSGGEVITEVIMCPPNLVGRVVGRGGGNVREVQSRSGARVQVNQQFPDGQDRQVEITGTQAAVKAAAELVHYIMENGPVLPAPGMPLVAGGGGHYGGGPGGPGVATAGLAPGTAAVTVECPKSCIGRVIGRGGDTVSRIQRETQAKVHIDQNVPEGAPVKVNISGYEPAVHAAIKLVQDIMVNGSAGFGGGGGGGGGYGGGYGQQPHVGAYGGGGRGGVGGGEATEDMLRIPTVREAVLDVEVEGNMEEEAAMAVKEEVDISAALVAEAGGLLPEVTHLVYFHRDGRSTKIRMVLLTTTMRPRV